MCWLDWSVLAAWPASRAAGTRLRALPAWRVELCLDVFHRPAADREHDGGVLASVDRRADGDDEAVFAKVTEPFLR